jgi:DeoR/GlpR family transcriptional regulator of sugar metabolism
MAYYNSGAIAPLIDDDEQDTFGVFTNDVKIYGTLDVNLGSRLVSTGGSVASLSFFGITGASQANTTIAGATLVTTSGTTLCTDTTFDGYTLQQVVRAMKDYGLLKTV